MIFFHQAAFYLADEDENGVIDPVEYARFVNAVSL